MSRTQMRKSKTKPSTARNIRSSASSSDDEYDRLRREEMEDYDEEQERLLSAQFGEASEAAEPTKRKRRAETDKEIEQDLAGATRQKRMRTFTAEQLLGEKGLMRVKNDFPKMVGKRRSKVKKGDEIKAAAAFGKSLVAAYRSFSYNLYPHMAFEDVLLKIDALGRGKEVKLYVNGMREDSRRDHLEKMYGRDKAARMINELENGLRSSQDPKEDDGINDGGDGMRYQQNAKPINPRSPTSVADSDAVRVGSVKASPSSKSKTNDNGRPSPARPNIRYVAEVDEGETEAVFDESDNKSILPGEDEESKVSSESDGENSQDGVVANLSQLIHDASEDIDQGHGNPTDIEVDKEQPEIDTETRIGNSGDSVCTDVSKLIHDATQNTSDVEDCLSQIQNEKEIEEETEKSGDVMNKGSADADSSRLIHDAGECTDLPKDEEDDNESHTNKTESQVLNVAGDSEENETADMSQLIHDTDDDREGAEENDGNETESQTPNTAGDSEGHETADLSQLIHDTGGCTDRPNDEEAGNESHNNETESPTLNTAGDTEENESADLSQLIHDTDDDREGAEENDDSERIVQDKNSL